MYYKIKDKDYQLKYDKLDKTQTIKVVCNTRKKK